MRKDRGMPAQVLHNTYRHYYVSVDTTASNWESYLLDRINELKYNGILHIMDYTSKEEIKRLHV